MIAGLEIRPRDRLDEVRAKLRRIMCDAFLALPQPRRTEDDYTLAIAVECKVREQWPRRAFFLEVGLDAEGEGWVQVYQPFGMPRSDR